MTVIYLGNNRRKKPIAYEIAQKQSQLFGVGDNTLLLLFNYSVCLHLPYNLFFCLFFVFSDCLRFFFRLLVILKTYLQNCGKSFAHRRSVHCTQAPYSTKTIIHYYCYWMNCIWTFLKSFSLVCLSSHFGVCLFSIARSLYFTNNLPNFMCVNIISCLFIFLLLLLHFCAAVCCCCAFITRKIFDLSKIDYILFSG